MQWGFVVCHAQGKLPSYMFWCFGVRDFEGPGTVKQLHLQNQAKKGLKMRHTFSTNFGSPSLFALTAFDFGRKKLKKTAVEAPVSMNPGCPQN